MLKSDGSDERLFSLRSLEQQNGVNKTHQKQNGMETQTSVGAFQQEKIHLEEFGDGSASD